MASDAPNTYWMAEGRAKHEPSGLWHYSRAYGDNENNAKLNLHKEVLRRAWALDSDSVRTSQVTKGDTLWPTSGVSTP